MSGGLGDVDGLAKRIAGTDPYPHLYLVVETPRGTEGGRPVAGFHLAMGTPHGRDGGPDRGGTTVIADRDVLVIRQQRIVGAELAPDVGCVMNTDVKIRVVADVRRQMHLHSDALCRCGSTAPRCPPR